VDLSRGELTVRRSVVELDGEPPKIVDKTKAKRARVVPLLPPVVSALRSHRARQNEERLALKGLWEDDTIVFPNSRGGVMAGRNLSRRHLKPILKKAGLSEKTRAYDLRHSFATLWRRQGETTEVLSKLIGHARTSTTSDFYVHPGDREKRDAMGRFGALWE